MVTKHYYQAKVFVPFFSGSVASGGVNRPLVPPGPVKLAGQNQPWTISRTVAQVILKIMLIARKQRRHVAEHKHVFRIEMSGGITEIKAAGDDNAARAGFDRPVSLAPVALRDG